jgi:hypothetical protein
VPGIYFAGTITQGAAGLRKHGIPGYSGAVHGHRYNSRILVRHLAERRFGIAPERPAIAPSHVVDYLLDEATRAPELWNQKAYLARVVSTDNAAGVRDDGILPLSDFVDSGGPDGIAMTVEADGAGNIYPVVYVRRRGAVSEHPMEPDPLMDFSGPIHRRQLADVLGQIVSPGPDTG